VSFNYPKYVFLKCLLLSGFCFAEQSNNFKSDILYIGDSHSVGGLGVQLNESLSSLTNPSTQKPFRVLSAAACGSASGSTLVTKGPHTGEVIGGWVDPKQKVTSSCGVRTCIPNSGKQICTKDKKGSSESLVPLLKESNPQSVIIALGSNMVRSYQKNQVLVIERSVAGLIDQVKTICEGGKCIRNCIWVGPPQLSEKNCFNNMTEVEYNKYVDFLRDVVVKNKCNFIDSRTKTLGKSIKDSMGLHYGANEGKAWGLEVYNEILDKNLLKTATTSGVESSKANSN
jgi:hypothetical protein